ncbi:fungal hydrophobin [Mycena albidolilacea]|uniref:Hydrophobin n=1 Tax=Mycena albidolilacea TaxID=1033008 RepID=A0AAD7AQB8_9AGAR|nr:fungal hydrophobin [Mycena albidolilacea]
MFPKISLTVTTVLATLAVASPINSPPPPPPGTVNQCCNSVQQSNSAGLGSILGLLGVVLNAVVPIGLGCSPITILGNNWYSQTGLIIIGCLPITA